MYNYWNTKTKKFEEHSFVRSDYKILVSLDTLYDNITGRWGKRESHHISTINGVEFWWNDGFTDEAGFHIKVYAPLFMNFIDENEFITMW